MQPLRCVIRTLLLSALLPWLSTGQSHVRGPSEPVIALVGEETLLSCHLDPMMDAQDMEVLWYRSNPSGLVYGYGASQDYMAQQMPEYQGRTELLNEDITKGQVTLRIHSIQPFDDGEYRCVFESSTFYNEAQIEVFVTVSGAAPHIHIEPVNTEEVKLTCTTMGWFPEPEVQWWKLQEQILTADYETMTAEENELFHVETSVTVDKSSGRAMSCLIINRVLSEVKEMHITVADALFSRNYPWIVALAVLLSLLAVAATFLAVYAVRERKKHKCWENVVLHPNDVVLKSRIDGWWRNTILFQGHIVCHGFEFGRIRDNLDYIWGKWEELEKKEKKIKREKEKIEIEKVNINKELRNNLKKRCRSGWSDKA